MKCPSLWITWVNRPCTNKQQVTYYTMLQQSRLSWSKFWNVYRTLSVLKNVIWRPVNLVCIFVSRYRRNIPLFQFMLNNSSLYFPIMINGDIVDTQYNYALRPRERNSNIRGTSTNRFKNFTSNKYTLCFAHD